MTSNRIVTVSDTAMDGPTVRWFRTLGAANVDEPMVTACRARVEVRSTVGTLEDACKLAELVDEAAGVMLALRAGEDVRNLATHRRRTLLSGVEPLDEP